MSRNPSQHPTLLLLLHLLQQRSKTLSKQERHWLSSIESEGGTFLKMSPSREVYLHCRIIDEAPCNMYTKAGYGVVKTDSILTLLKLQRRKHLARKDLPVLEDASAVDIPKEELS